MTYEERIRHDRPAMSKSFAKLADFLLDSYIKASFMTASELAHALNLDAATVVRFSQHLGYKGYPELLREIRDKVRRNLLYQPQVATEPDSLHDVVMSSLDNLNHELDQMRLMLDIDSVEKLVNAIDKARRIILLVESPAQPAAYNLVYFLEQGGFPIYIARPGVIDFARTVHTASQQDLLLAIDVTGQSPFISRSLAEAKARNIPTAAIVGAASLPTARSASVVLAASEHPSSTSGMLVVSAIIYVLVEALHWSFSQRFSGAEQAIADLANRIQESED
ncbi:MAG: MurR/RpiR family transcriptional regulator [Anaerolineales bacterium]